MTAAKTTVSFPLSARLAFSGAGSVISYGSSPTRPVFTSACLYKTQDGIQTILTAADHIPYIEDVLAQMLEPLAHKIEFSKSDDNNALVLRIAHEDDVLPVLDKLMGYSAYTCRYSKQTQSFMTEDMYDMIQFHATHLRMTAPAVKHVIKRAVTTPRRVLH